MPGGSARTADVKRSFAEVLTISVFPMSNDPTDPEGRVSVVEPLNVVTLSKVISELGIISIPGCKKLPPIFRLIDGG
jgi:hypothetical protein